MVVYLWLRGWFVGDDEGRNTRCFASVANQLVIAGLMTTVSVACVEGCRNEDGLWREMLFVDASSSVAC
jgi:hypothetical protein